MSESIIYKDHLIKIEQDTTPMNPMTEWDHGCEVMVSHDRTLTEYGDGVSLQSAPEFDRETISKNWKDIADAVTGCESRSNMLAFLNEYCPHYLSNYHNAVDAFNETIASVFENNLSDREKCESLETLYNLTDTHVAYSEQANGYSQSDWHVIVVVKDTSEYKKDGELSDESRQTAIDYCKCVANEYKCWAYGDVHGYSTYGLMDQEDIDNEEDEEDSDFREDLHSCWGFFGEYLSEGYNYMIQEAKNAIDHAIQADKDAERESYTIKVIGDGAVELYYENHIIVVYSDGDLFQCGVVFRDTVQEIFEYVDGFNSRHPNWFKNVS